MTWVINFLAALVARIAESWFHQKEAESKGALQAEVEGLRRAEAQEQEAKKIDAAPPPQDQTDDAFLTKYRRD